MDVENSAPSSSVSVSSLVGMTTSAGGAITEPLLINESQDHDDDDDDDESALLTNIHVRRRRRQQQGGNGASPITFYEYTTLQPDRPLFPMRWSSWIRMMLVCTIVGSPVGLMMAIVPVFWDGDYFLTLMPLLIVTLFISVLFLRRKRRFERIGAVKFLEKEISQTKCVTGKDSPQVAMLYYKLGCMYEMYYGDLHNALEAYSVIVNTIPDVNLHTGGALVYHAIGRVHFLQRDFESAIKAFEKALRLRQLQPRNIYRVIRELNAIAVAYERMSTTAIIPTGPARRVQDQDSSIEKENDEEIKQRMSYMQLALDRRLQALELLHGRGQTQTMDTGKCYMLIGSTYVMMASGCQNDTGNHLVQYDTNKLDKALENYEKALEIFILNVGEYPSVGVIARLYEKMGSVYDKKHDTHKAIEFYRLAIEVHHRGGKSDEHREVASLMRKVADIEECSA